MLKFEDFLDPKDTKGFEDPEKFKKWEPIVRERREKIANSIPQEYKVDLPESFEDLVAKKFNAIEYVKNNVKLPAEEDAITSLSIESLLSLIENKKLKSVDVLKAYARKAVIANQFTNCLFDVFVEEGIERATYLDEYLEKNGKTIGPLHGLPISLKEHLNYKGKVTHAGYVSMLNNVSETNAVTVEILRTLGAVFYVRTSSPQTLMHLDSNNNVTGPTRNPYNLNLTAGGSSSGEGALVGFGGSPIGIGSDIGGSIRSPSAFCNLYGMKPTTLRVSTYGSVSAASPNLIVLGTVGPMARRIDDLELWYDAYINHGKPWMKDPNCVLIPWRKIEKPMATELKIAVMYDDGIVKPTPPVARALKTVVAKLKSAGVELTEFKPIMANEAYDVCNKTYSSDGGATQKEFLAASGEPLVKLTKWCLGYGNGHKGISITEQRDMNKTRTEIRRKFYDFLDNSGADFVLGPAFYTTAPPSENAYDWSYTCIYNFLDFPALAFKSDIYADPKLDSWPSEHLGYKYRSRLEELCLADYNADAIKGAPVGLQLAGRRFRDEEVLAAGKTIAEILSLD